jgi:hypothetical protein
VQLVRHVREPPMTNVARRTLVHKEPRLVPSRRRVLRDQLARQVVLELLQIHPTATVTLPTMDADAIKRAQERIDQAAAGRIEPAAVDATLERAREQVEALAATAAELEATLPSRLGDALQDGLRAQVAPVGRNLAEIRGLMNHVIRRLERVEGDLLAERHARVDDLALLVDLVTSGWRSVEQRLTAIEQRLGAADDGGAAVYRLAG